MKSFLLLCPSFVLREMISCERIYTPVSVVCTRERSGYVGTPTPVLVISFEGEVCLYDHS